MLGYLQDFLFSSERCREPIANLSGGERNRLLLARLFTRPANVLVLDEPTNDLDAETLELLEARLVDYPGTVLVVSHDRQFLDNLCTSTLVFEGGGRVREHAGGYSDWKRVADARREAEPPRRAGGSSGGRDGQAPGPGVSGRAPDVGREVPPRARKLSFAERKEWEALPGRIETLEAELDALHRRMGDPDFFRGDPGAIRSATERSQAIPGEIEGLFARWAELDERA